MSTTEVATLKKTMCPKCYNMIEVPSSVRVQDVVTCKKCKTEFEILTKVPITLGWLSNTREKKKGGIFPR